MRKTINSERDEGEGERGDGLCSYISFPFSLLTCNFLSFLSVLIFFNSIDKHVDFNFNFNSKYTHPTTFNAEWRDT